VCHWGQHWAAGRGSGISCESRNSVLQSGESTREPAQTHFLYNRRRNDEAVSDEAASVNGAKANLTPVRAKKLETQQNLTPVVQNNRGLIYSKRSGGIS